MPVDDEFTQVSIGQPFMEFLPIMINKVGVVIALEVISGMQELSSYPVLLHLRLHFLFLNALFCLFLLIPCAVQFLLMNGPSSIGIE